MLLGLLLVIQILISIFLVIVILLQSSKGGGLAGIAGGLGSSTVFGGRSAANFLTKATTVLATLFFINCLGMAILTARTDQSASVTQQAVQAEGAPVSPVPSIPGGATVPANTNANGTPATPPAGTTNTAEQPAAQPSTSPAEGNSESGN